MLLHGSGALLRSCDWLKSKGVAIAGRQLDGFVLCTGASYFVGSQCVAVCRMYVSRSVLACEI